MGAGRGGDWIDFSLILVAAQTEAWKGGQNQGTDSK